jgi:hypothetical protein
LVAGGREKNMQGPFANSVIIALKVESCQAGSTFSKNG